MHTIPQPILEVFRQVYARLQPTDINWVLTGSLAFAMQGVGLTPRDIDLQTDRQGAYRIEALFAGHVTRPVTDSDAAERVRSHYGDLLIEGVLVQIMGDMQKRESLAHEWEAPTDLNAYKRWIEFEHMLVSVLSLEYEAEAYRKMGRLERAELLAKYAKIGG